MRIKTLQELRDFTKDLPANTEVRVESIHKYNLPSGSSPVFDVKVFDKDTDTPKIRIVPETIILSSGDKTLEATHRMIVR